MIGVITAELYLTVSSAVLFYQLFVDKIVRFGYYIRRKSAIQTCKLTLRS